MASNQGNEWTMAAWSEWESLLSNGAFESIAGEDPESGSLVIKSKWVFKVKRNEYGEIERYKARLVARGDHRKYGANYKEAFTPVADICRSDCLRKLRPSGLLWFRRP